MLMNGILLYQKCKVCCCFVPIMGERKGGEGRRGRGGRGRKEGEENARLGGFSYLC